MTEDIKRLGEAFKKLRCRMRGHKFTLFCDGLKRRCDRCSREEWVMSNPYPRIGEPAHYWKHMDWKGLTPRRITVDPNRRHAYKYIQHISGSATCSTSSRP